MRLERVVEVRAGGDSFRKKPRLLLIEGGGTGTAQRANAYRKSDQDEATTPKGTCGKGYAIGPILDRGKEGAKVRSAAGGLLYLRDSKMEICPKALCSVGGGGRGEALLLFPEGEGAGTRL